MKKLNGEAFLAQVDGSWRVAYGTIFSRTFASRNDAMTWANEAGYRLHAVADNRPHIRGAWTWPTQRVLSQGQWLRKATRHVMDLPVAR